MSDKLVVSIVGTNGVSQVFNQVTRDAQTMGQTVTRASQDAGRSQTQMAESAEASAARSSASYEKIGKAIGAAGLAFGAFTLLATKAAGDSEASAARLDTAFQNAGLAVDDYQSRITELNNTGLKLAFDDEDVQDALARLVTATGNVEKSFKDVGLAEDIARAQGISLAAATQIVVQAENGRFRGLAALGVAIDATSTKESVLAAAQAKFAGQADAYAKTGAANFDRWKNTAENALETVGSKLEGLQVPIIALSTAAGAIGPLAGSLKELAASSLLLDTALGPIGLAAAAIAAAAGIIYLTRNTKEYDDVARTAASATQDLTNYFRSLAQSLDPANAKAMLDFGIALNTVIDDATARQADLNKIQGLFDMGIDPTFGLDINPSHIDSQVQAISGLTQAQLELLDTNHDLSLSVDEVSAAIARYQANTDRLNSDQATKVQNDVKAIFNQSGVDYAKAIAGIMEWDKELQSGTITGEQYVALLEHAAADFTVFGRDLTTATAATAAHTAAVSANGNAVAAQMAVYDAQNRSLNQAIDFNTANTAAIDDDTAARKANASAIESQMAAYGAHNQSLSESPVQAKRADNFGQLDESNNARSSLSNLLDLFNQMNPAADTARHAVDGLSSALDDQAKAAADADAANRKQLGGYYDVANGIYTADSALSAFKATQDGILSAEGQYTGQVSEYSSQLNNLNTAYDIINKKKTDGIALTQQETDFLNGYTDAQTRLSGGVSDANEQLGFQAEQYAKNMKQGDELNKNLKDQTGSVDDLVGEIKTLIDTLLGVPPEVKTKVDAETSTASSQLNFLKGQLDALDGRIVTSYAQVRSSGDIFFPSTGASTQTNRLGGLVGYAGGGVVARMAEAGPELLHFSNGGSTLALTDGLYNVPRGTFVDTAPATKAKLGGMGSETIVIQNMTVIAHDPEQFSRQLRSHAVTGSRR